MRSFAYSVSIVSNTSAQGINNAITISSLTSVSVDPPSILICINKSSTIHNSLIMHSLFCVNLLSDKQKRIAEICSDPKKSDKRFQNNKWVGKNPPILSDSLLSLVCKIHKIVNYETHSIIIGVVQKINNSTNQNNLLYKNQGYLSITTKDSE